MEILLLTLAIIMSVIGILGAVLPGIPGTPLSLLAIYIAHWTDRVSFTTEYLWVMVILTAIICLLDYVAPIWMTQKFGGTKAATNASIVGMIAGFFIFPPWGVIFCPFFAVLFTEYYMVRCKRHALKIAFLSFVAFLLTTGVKLIFSGVILFDILAEIWKSL